MALLLPLALLLLLLCLAPANSFGATLFSDNFESGYAAWTRNPTANVTLQATPANGTQSVRLARSTSSDCTIYHAVSTVGFGTLSVSYYLATQSIPAGEDFRVQYYSGTSWITVQTITTANLAFGPQTATFPVGAENNANFRLRFLLSRGSTGSPNYYAYVDDVVLTGEVKVCTLDLTKTGSGTVNVNSVNYTLPWSGTFNYGDSVTLEAVPDTAAHYHFGTWSQDLTGTTNPSTITITDDTQVRANFVLDTFTLSLTASPTGGGAVAVNGTNHTLPWSGGVGWGTTCTLTSNHGTGYAFSSWSGDVTGTTDPVSFTMDSNKAVTANFVAHPPTITVNGTHGSVQVSGGTTYPLPWSTTFTPSFFYFLLLTAVPDTGYHFVNWTGAVTGTNPTTIVLRLFNNDDDWTSTANFAPNAHTVSFTGSGGQVSINGTSHALPWSESVTYGSTLTLQALPDTGNGFTGWSGALTGTTNPTTFTLSTDANVSIAVGFAVIPTHQVSFSGSHGAISVDGDSHDLPWSGTFVEGTTLSLQATPLIHYHFTTWSGGVTGTTNPTSLLVDTDKSVNVGFAIDQHLLTVNGSDGSVSLNGDSHTLPWSATFDYGTTVNLVVTPIPHHHFTSWSGDLTGTAASTSLLMDGVKTVTAGIEGDPCAFNLNGNMGQVKVNGTPHNLPYTGNYAWGSTLALEALPPTGYVLKKWSGDLNGSDNPASLVLEGEKTVTATFWVRQYQLTVKGSGSVLLNGKSQALPFSKSYEFGAGITLEVPATTCDRFNGWESDTGDIDYSNPLVINIDKDYDLTPLGISPLNIFTDVPCDYWAVREIAACYRAGIVTGYGDGTYQPTLVVTRDQMAVYISRALAEGDANIGDGPSTATFPDVPTSYWAFKYVEYAASHGIVVGYWDGNYQPTLAVDRGQMAVYVARSMVRPLGDGGMAGYTPPTTPTFSDVGTDFWSYAYVEYLAEKGTVAGYYDGTYRPAVSVTRDQMAVYVQRAFGLAR